MVFFSKGDEAMNPIESTTPASIRQSIMEGSTRESDPREDVTYSSIFFKMHRLTSLLKMATTGLYVSVVLTVVVFLVVFANSSFGNLPLYFFLKISVLAFPFEFLVSQFVKNSNILLGI